MKLKRDISMISNYDDSMPKRILEHFYHGRSVVQFCRDVQISRSTFSHWCKSHSEFADAVEVGQQYCEAFWEDWFVANLDNKNVNAPLAKLYFANRFGWVDKQDVSSQVSAKIALSEEAAEIRELRKQYEKPV